MNQLVVEIARHLPKDNSSRRVFHGRGHCFPGFEDVVIDWYCPILLIYLYRERELSWLNPLVESLRQLVPELEGVILQKRYLRGGPIEKLWGQIPQQLEALEDGLRFQLRLSTAQNIGYFPDMAVGRRLIRGLCREKSVLNLFAYSCGFSVAALAGGARHVVNLDMNSGALELGRLNHQLNSVDLRSCSFLCLELFRSFNKLKKLGPFDCIICDPPQEQGRSFRPERDWPRLLKRLPELLGDRGYFLLCLNGPDKSPERIMQLCCELIPQAKLLESLAPGEDFPEIDPDKGTCLLLYQHVNDKL